MLIALAYSLVDIIAEGAIPYSDTIATQFLNAKIIKQSILKANSTLTDRIVRIPKHTFYSMPIVV